MIDKDKELKRADAKYRRARICALDALVSAMTPGRHVKWKHGKHWRLGEVVRVVGFSYDSARVRCKSAISGKEVDVCSSSILEHL